MKQPRLSSPAVLAVLGCLFFASLPGLMLFPAPVIFFSLSMLAWRLLSLRYHWRPMPAWLKALLVISAIAVLYLSYGHLFGRRIAAAMLLLMMALKAVELYTRRDARVLASLCLFLATTYFLFLQNPAMLVYGLVVLLLVLQSLNILQLERITTIAANQPPAATQQDNLSASQQAGQSGFNGLLSSLRVILYALPLGLVLFVVFPRLAAPIWGAPEAALDGKTGLSDEMSPGSIQNLFMDDSPAFRVEFLSDRPPNSELYWRGPVLWKFDGRRWSTLFRGYRIIPPSSLPIETMQSIHYRVQLEPSERRWLYALDYPVVKPADSQLTQGYQLFTKQPVINPKTYTVTSEPRFAHAPELSGAFRQMALELPTGYNPKAREWIKQLREQYPAHKQTKTAAADIQLVNRVLEYFTEEAFYYSLSPPPLGRHSVDDFLFNTRSGFCEHYASTFTVLMRMAGIPARVVTGYQGGYYSTAGDYLLVRQSDAHAWAEIWLDGKGWQRVDPTNRVAPERILSGAMDTFSDPRNWHDFTWLRNLRNQLDLVQHFWNSWVMDFSAQSQTKLLEILGLDHLDKRLLALLILAPLFLIIAISTAFLLKQRIIKARNPAVRLYKEYLHKLNKAGFEISSNDNATSVASKVAAKLKKDNIELNTQASTQAIAAARAVAEAVNLRFYSKQQVSFKVFETLVYQSLSKISKVGIQK